MSKTHGIIIFGANGSGKTTLGRELARILNVKHIDHEDYAFEKSNIPYAVERSREDCVNLMLADIEKNGSFVISAVTGDFGDVIPQHYELAVYLSAPKETRIERIKQRAYEQHGERIRKSGDLYEQHLDFVNFVSERSLTPIERWAETLLCPIIHIDGTEDWRINATKIAEQYYEMLKGDEMKTQNIYDNPVFFEGYKKLRENPDNANLLEEKPALYSLAPDLVGKTVLDLGCGYGENCAEYKRLGASKVMGVDISEKMLTVAKDETADIEYLRIDMNDLSDIQGTFDVVFSSLAVHYIIDFDKFCNQVAALLHDGGCFVFSQEHPNTTAPIKGASWTRDENGNKLHYNLSDYARSGKRETKWIVDGVVKYHRTFSEIVNALVSNGFIIEKMIEPVPDEATLARLPYYADEFHKPNFLLIKARKDVK